MKQSFVFTFLLLLATSLAAQEDKLIDWRGDIEYLRVMLPARHANIYFKVPKAEYEKGLDALAAQAADATNLENRLRMQQFIASLGDSHTRLQWGYKGEELLPFRVAYFSDGYFISNVEQRYGELLGRRITHINHIPVEQVADSLATLITIDNAGMFRSRIPSMMSVEPTLRFFGFIDSDSVYIQVAPKAGTPETYALPLHESLSKAWAQPERAKLAYCWRSIGTYFNDTLMSDGLYFVQYNICGGREISRAHGKKEGLEEIPSFKEFEKRVLKTLKRPEVKTLVFDMRFNGGGASRQGTEMIQKIAKNKKINRKGGIYVVIGRQTFSSAILNTLDFLQNTDAILIGEDTGGKPNHYGEIRSFDLPSSGLRVVYSTKYFVKEATERPTIEPDIRVEASFQDYINGIDPVLERIRAELGKGQ
jgi:hypothetical protein